MADLNEFLARLGGQPVVDPAAASINGTHNHAGNSSTTQRQPSVPPPLFSPSLTGTFQRQVSMGSNSTHGGAAGQDRAVSSSDRATNLLNLLKFNPASGDAISPASRSMSSSQPVVGIDFLPNLGRPIASPRASSRAQTPRAQTPGNNFVFGASPIGAGQASTIEGQSAAEKPQDVLLKLLNRTPSSTYNIPSMPTAEATNAAVTARTDALLSTLRGSQQDGTPSPSLLQQSEPSAQTQSQPQPAAKSGLFTYVSPFEQLAASSPRNRTPKPKSVADSTPNVPDTSAGLPPGGPFTTEAVAKSADPTPLPDGRSQVEALIGIGSQNASGESVSAALSEIAAQADKAASEAIARADVGSVAAPSTQSRDDAVAKPKTGDTDTRKPTAKAKSNEATGEAAADSWESADAEETAEAAKDIPMVAVYDMPMKPFTFLAVQASAKPPAQARQEIVVKIASLKKDFDQVDRALVTATANHITYTMAKGGGFRVIKQDDGSNAQIFKGSDHVMFNIALGASSPTFRSNAAEVVLATGVNGSVYWINVLLDQGEDFTAEKLQSSGFIMPPLPTQDENNTSQAQLKTRAKKSSRHPEYFAMGRGKSIYIVWPDIVRTKPYIDTATRIVDSEKYLSERCLKITTGKAGKDFAFSEDDSMIASLDKAGRIKLWDIRSLVASANGEADGRRAPIEIKTPLMTLQASSNSDKSWPTSVMFADRERATSKGIALRYLLVGMNQNHTLQLWDLGIGRIVQELNFPHENETDAICSIAYHPKSAIITIGHPTRNSIYLVHLSAPKYNLSAMSQAHYVERLAQGDKTLPRPESTAIMTGIREISLASIGQLRSLDVLNPTHASVEKSDSDDNTIFEIYMMHARGVACLTLKRQDLGWDQKGRVVNALDAVREGFVVIKDIQTAPEGSEEAEGEGIDAKSGPDTAVSQVAAPSAGKQDAPTAKSAAAHKEVEPLVNQPKSVTSIASSSNGLPVKADPKENGKKKSAGTSSGQSSARAPIGTMSVTPKATVEEPTVAEIESKQATKETSSLDVPAPTVANTAPVPETPKAATTTTKANIDINGLKDTFAPYLQSLLSNHFNNLHRRVDEDRRVQEAAGAAKQDAILRLVSSSLTENVEKSLARIITANIEKSVVPVLTGATSATIDRKLSELVGPRLDMAISNELKSALPAAVGRALQSPEVLTSISGLVSQKVANHVESHFAAVLAETITPAFKTLSINTAKKVTGEVEQRVSEQLQQFEIQRRSDRDDIERLTTLTGDLLHTVRTMADTQVTLREEIIKLQEQLADQRERAVEARQAELESEPVAPRDEELEEIAGLMTDGKAEEGTLRVSLYCMLHALYLTW